MRLTRTPRAHACVSAAQMSAPPVVIDLTMDSDDERSPPRPLPRRNCPGAPARHHHRVRRALFPIRLVLQQEDDAGSAGWGPPALPVPPPALPVPPYPSVEEVRQRKRIIRLARQLQFGAQGAYWDSAKSYPHDN